MKVLTLRQPWASAVADGHKKWETRSWKPSQKMQDLMRDEGFLIHSSQKLRYTDRTQLRYPPWNTLYPLQMSTNLPLGRILMHVKLGRIISTSEWRKIYDPFKLTGAQPADLPHHPTQEHLLGDYAAGRWAWELLPGDPYQLPDYAVKGELRIWDFAQLSLKTDI